MICIIDYEIGNVLSVKNAITKIGLECKISRNENDISCSSERLFNFKPHC